jgi:esterase/lipase superfamily enzyme
MSKITERWRSERLQGQEVTVCRWGDVGRPVLLFPTAAGDAEECERFHLVRSLAKPLEEQRIKLYSVDSVAGQAWLARDGDARNAARLQNGFDAFVYHELVPAIRSDCRDGSIEIVVAGASIGAYNALVSICRHPDVFSKAICMSGTYDIWKKFGKGEKPHDYLASSPLDFVPHMPEGDVLRRLRERFVLLTHGKGPNESPEESWRVANTLGARGIGNRVVEWGEEWPHDWQTWRAMLPLYVEELVPQGADKR